jgi:hypothetical protein
MATVVECSGGARYRRAWAVVNEDGSTIAVTTSFRHALESAARLLTDGWA